MDNPHEFATVAVQTIKSKLADQLVSGIRYEKINDWYEMTQFDTEISAWQQYLVPSRKSDGSEGSSLYDHVLYESEVEKSFVEDLEARRGRAALPEAAALVHCAHAGRQLQPGLGHCDGERGPPGPGAPLLYLVRETKSTTVVRTSYARTRSARFTAANGTSETALGVDFEVATSAAELP